MESRPRLSLVRSSRYPGLRAISNVSNFGYISYDTAAFPDRLYAGMDAAGRPPSIVHSEAEIDVTHVATPLEVLTGRGSGGEDVAWPTETRRSVARLEALWLLTEDRFRLLDAGNVEPLAHQASLVEHVLSSPDLDRVLVADEVGLGKTIEAALIIQRLQERNAGLRVLYLTEARLVRNVIEEFERVGLRPREWSTAVQEARLTPGDSDPLVVASMHRAVVNFDLVAASGPWDVLFVDEAHHLTDWSADGSDPQQRMRLCRRLVRDRLTPGGRVYLLSGTPHQGSEERFRNLLRLLSPRDDERGARGRVIYRIKDDIRDWDQRPLFPRRRVNPPTEIHAGDEYTRWLGAVHELLTPFTLNGSRAAGWRRAQALQWCASSPQAGLAYLTRLAVRSGLTTQSLRVLEEAILALRPYRGGAEDEPLASLQARLLARQTMSEDDAEDVFRDPRSGLRDVLEMGVDLIRTDAIRHKLEHIFGWLGETPDEKFVVFAQPIETVFTLKNRLESHLGPGSVSLIVGEQEPDDRRREIDQFWSRDERRMLVSSRSGGEGINLQVARRLVHFDVPWNPMEMEQRVGRIHRYGGSQTVIIDTLVLADSREQRVLARSRARLGRIARDLDQDRLDVLFSRTMALIPLEELAALMAGENFGPLTKADEERIDRLITEGYDRWQRADADFRARSERVRTVERGATSDEDLRALLLGRLGVQPVAGWRRRVLHDDGNGAETRVSEEPAEVLRLADGRLGFIGRDLGVGLAGPGRNGTRPRRLGLNDAQIADAVRALVGEARRSEAADVPTGAGGVLVSEESWSALLSRYEMPSTFRSGAVLMVYLTRRLDRDPAETELGAELHAWLAGADGQHECCLSPEALADLVRAVRTPRPKRTRPALDGAGRLLDSESARLNELRRRTPGEPTVVVFPIAALWIEPTTDRLDAPSDALAGRV